MNKLKQIIIALSLLLVLAPFTIQTTLVPVFANDSILKTPDIAGTGPGNPLVKCDGGSGSPCEFPQLVALAQNIVNLVFAFAAFIAAAMFMYAGFLMLTSVGNIAQITKAKEVFRRVFVGFLIILLSFVIVQQLLKYLGVS